MQIVNKQVVYIMTITRTVKLISTFKVGTTTTTFVFSRQPG